MEELDIISKLIDVAPVVGVLGYWVYSEKVSNKKLKQDVQQYAADYKQMAENAIKIITLADDKLSKDQKSDEKVRDIHRMVSEVLEIIKGHKP